MVEKTKEILEKYNKAYELIKKELNRSSSNKRIKE